MRVFDIPNAPLIDPRSSLSLCPPIQVGSFPLSSSLGIGIAFVPPRNGSFCKRGRFLKKKNIFLFSIRPSLSPSAILFHSFAVVARSPRRMRRGGGGGRGKALVTYYVHYFGREGGRGGNALSPSFAAGFSFEQGREVMQGAIPTANEPPHPIRPSLIRSPSQCNFSRPFRPPRSNRLRSIS